MQKKTEPDVSQKEHQENNNMACGIVMPITRLETPAYTYDEATLATMRIATEEAIKEAGLSPRPVWERNDSLQIKSNIINNIFEYKYIVCIICGLNANAMVELGMAVAFGKHVVIVEDQYTKCPFDLNEQKYIDFPTGSGYEAIQNYKDALREQLKMMHDGTCKTFLSHYGPWKTIKEIPTQEIGTREIASLIRNISDRLEGVEEHIFKSKIKEKKYLYNEQCYQPKINFSDVGDFNPSHFGGIYNHLNDLYERLNQFYLSVIDNSIDYVSAQKKFDSICAEYKHLCNSANSDIFSQDKQLKRFIMEIDLLYDKVAKTLCQKSC